MPTSIVNPGVETRAFGHTPEGAPVTLFVLTNARGLTADVCTYGGIVTALRVPDRQGALADVVLGYPSLDGYLRSSPYFGALVGRFGNRIGHGRFTLDGKGHQLVCNNGENHLHGGSRGFDKVNWRGRAYAAPGKQGVALGYRSVDGEEGYPGNLDVEVDYALTDDDALEIVYRAQTDAPTLCNLTHHGYFNLDDAGAGDILSHRLTLAADRFTPTDAGLIPTGELARVDGTPFDFRKPTAIGARIGDAHEQLRRANGYDHNFVLTRSGPGLAFAARLEAARSGRVMEVHTTEPGVQFYSGNFLDGSITGKGGAIYRFRHGLCLETQHFPDAPNHPNFPSVVLRPGETYASTTVYQFSVAK